MNRPVTWNTPFIINSDKSRLPKWSYSFFDKLPIIGSGSNPRAVSLSLGQSIYTPEDTEATELLEDQRPYAGYLYTSVAFHSITNNRKDTWEFDIGVVGPVSMAEYSQNAVHMITGSSPAGSWDDQLKTEPTFEMIFESQWRILKLETNRGFGFDIIPHVGARLGNVKVYGNVGTQIRVGWNINDDYGSCPIRPGCETRSALGERKNNQLRDSSVSVSLYTSIDGRAVLYDIFLDGNTYTDSHSVEKETFVVDFISGVNISYKRFTFSYSYIYRTREYKAQKKPQLFGSFQMAVRY